MCLSARPPSKWPSETVKVRLLQFCKAITSCSDLRSRWGLNQSYSSRPDLSNGVSHSIYTHGSRVDSWLFVVGSQTANLIPGLSFCHNLCCGCPNGSCEPILDIYTSISFQWYKELLNARCFDLCNHSLKVWESTGTWTPKRRVHLGVWVFLLTLFLAHALETFCFGREPKAKVATFNLFMKFQSFVIQIQCHCQL
jgi:hypothetical protein